MGEGAGFAVFRLVLFGMLERSINVTFTTLDGTAIGEWEERQRRGVGSLYSSVDCVYVRV